MGRHASVQIPGPRPTRRLGLVLGLLGICALSASGTTAVHAAFIATTKNTSNTHRAGSVYLTEGHGAATAPFVVAGALPGSVHDRCVRVRTTGTLDSELRHYLQSSGALAPHLQLRVIRGTVGTGGTSTSCSGFTADTANHAGLGAGVVYDGTLAGFGTDWASGRADPVSTAPETWSLNEFHDYLLRLTVANDPVVQGNKNARVTFTWEARNL